MSTITKATVLACCGHFFLQNRIYPLKSADIDHSYLTIMSITKHAYTYQMLHVGQII
jgi:hypothetical protein